MFSIATEDGVEKGVQPESHCSDYEYNQYMIVSKWMKSRTDEEETELKANGENKDDLVHPVDLERGTNTLEGLPSEHLQDLSATNQTNYSTTNLDQSPAQHCSSHQTNAIDYEDGNFCSVTLAPVSG